MPSHHPPDLLNVVEKEIEGMERIKTSEKAKSLMIDGQLRTETNVNTSGY